MLFNHLSLELSFNNSFFTAHFLQVVELDFQYPSEGIHRRWIQGYRITTMAANSDQAAIVLSLPKRKPSNETQETLRTSQFPITNIQVFNTRTSQFSINQILFSKLQ